MLTKQGHIDFWVNSSARDYESALYNIKGKQYVFALFLFHLTIEKLLKAHWIKDNIGNTPPYSHDLKYLVGNTELDLKIEQIDFLVLANDWNISTRYPDYKETLFKKATSQYVEDQKIKVDDLRKCLLEKL
ncbi:MAG: HEPN domain-containing protein [Bacteroidota bacterium]|nr:HEPN domain-containing protein [Bacteroidota bacterium]